MMTEKKTIRIIGLISSPHKNGNTATLVRDALKAAQESGAQIEEIFLPDYDIQYCKGCFTCMSKGKCPIPDDFEANKQKLTHADGIVIGSPSYGLAPNAIYKTFSDRLGMYAVYASIMGSKYVVGISTAGAVGAAKVAKTLTRLSDGFFERGFVSGTIGAKVGWGSIEHDKKSRRKAAALGIKMVSDIASGRRYRFQGLFSRILMKAGLINIFKNNVINNRNGRMKAVYEELLSRGLIKEI